MKALEHLCGSFRPDQNEVCMSEKDPFDVFHTEPLLIIISGPSGVGKDAVLQLMKEHNVRFHFVVTATSRPKRENEREGVDYIFVSKAEFEQMIARDELLEYAVVYGDYKGIPKSQIREALASEKDVIMRIDVQGAATIRGICPGAVLIFLAAQDEAELEHRLRTRKSEPEEVILKRIQTARLEMKRVGEFDYVVENEAGQLTETVASIEAIIKAEHLRVQPRKVNL
jgi:guanylate kinase